MVFNATEITDHLGDIRLNYLSIYVQWVIELTIN